MRIFLLPVPLAVLALLLAGATGVAAAPGADIYGVGAGKSGIGGVGFSFDLSAHSGPNGDFGHVGVKVTTPTPGSFRVDVDCVNAFELPPPARAAISGLVTRVEPSGLLGIVEGDRIRFEVTDGGEPSAPVPVDGFLFSRNQVNCKLFGAIVSNNVTQGNIVVNAG